MASDPADGSSRASRPMLTAQNKQATRAKTTARGSEPPANATPAGIEAAMAAPGAMSVMLWNSTSRRPIALRRRPCVWVVVSLTAMAASGDLVPLLPRWSHGAAPADRPN